MEIHPQKIQIPLPAVFLDRDGTLIEDADYLRRVQDIRWIPGVPEALRALQNKGYRLVVVSNQSGIARGYFGTEALQAVEDAMVSHLRRFQVHIDGWYYCPHLPEVDGPCACRKPGNGMLEQAIAELHLQRKGSWMVGDSLRDVEAGRRSGIPGALVRTGKALAPEALPATVPCFLDVPAFARALLAQEL